MKTSICQCGNRIFFDNSHCQSCHSELGFIVDDGALSSLTLLDDNRWVAHVNQRHYRKCYNYTVNRNCNWMIADDDANKFCLSCRMSEVIPNLRKSENIERWNKIERAKRRLVYSLIRLELPFKDKQTDPLNGLSFRLMEDNKHYSEFASGPVESLHIVTGHRNSTITLNIAEADTVFREKVRTRMQERYRTILGHLRHESGHFFWEKLVRNTNFYQEFQRLFGDEKLDYQTALARYYKHGPVDDWQLYCVSAYASSHPWEDFAECWAHYLHIIDTLETTYDFGGEIYTSEYLVIGQRFDKKYLSTVMINQLLDEWSTLAILLNEMNRSLGLADAYPFLMTDLIIGKMAFIHKIVTNW